MHDLQWQGRWAVAGPRLWPCGASCPDRPPDWRRSDCKQGVAGSACRLGSDMQPLSYGGLACCCRQVASAWQPLSHGGLAYCCRQVGPLCMATTVLCWARSLLQAGGAPLHGNHCLMVGSLTAAGRWGPSAWQPLSYGGLANRCRQVEHLCMNAAAWQCLAGTF